MDPPPVERQLPIWDRPIPGAGRAPLVWLLAAGGGVGVSTLAQVLAPAADAGARWPGGFGKESPFVVLVARETITGLTRAHDALRQHHAGLAGSSEVLGLLTVAARPGRLPAEIRRYRELVASLTPRLWHLPWYEEWTLVAPEQLPVWTPGAAPVVRRRKVDPLAEVPVEVCELGEQFVAAAREVLEDSAGSYGPRVLQE
ncbi:MAG: hypothetical protein J2P17_20835 [Mycobacterium sp.]|nr:hypothetical protein [Mycobacterium sp.]